MKKGGIMQINYPRNSKFLNKIEDAITKNKDKLLSGRIITVEFSKQGYNGDIKVIIIKNNSKQFNTNWYSNDPTRFPARIKAAALALYNQGFYGNFTISHHSGLLTLFYHKSSKKDLED